MRFTVRFASNLSDAGISKIFAQAKVGQSGTL
jgi:hypothetical protein